LKSEQDARQRQQRGKRTNSIIASSSLRGGSTNASSLYRHPDFPTRRHFKEEETCVPETDALVTCSTEFSQEKRMMRAGSALRWRRQQLRGG
jgi:hypothetical protein